MLPDIGAELEIQERDGVLWVVDAWDGQCFIEKSVRMALTMCHEWKVARLAWDASTIGKRIYREAFQDRQRRMADGFHVPQYVAVPHEGVPKEQRIERMVPNFQEGNIKFPLWTEIDGYRPLPHPHAASIRNLVDQFDTMTMEGTIGHDDLIDAFQMLHFIADRRPRRRPKRTESQRLLELWESKGLAVDPSDVPRRSWTPRMHEEFTKRTQPSFVFKDERGFCDAFV